MAVSTKPSKGNNKWLRFSLRELLLLIGTVSVVLVVLAKPHRQRRAVDQIRILGGSVEHYYRDDVNARVYEPDPIWVRRLMGEQFVRVGQVDLSGTSIGDSQLKPLSALGDIRELRLSNTQVDGSGLSHLRNKSKLRVLHLNNTQVSDRALALIGEMTQLEELSLAGTRITDEGMASLGVPGSIRTINIDGTQVTAETLERIRRWPNVELLQMMGLDLYRRDLVDVERLQRKIELATQSNVISDPRLVQEILVAWEARHRSVRSFSYSWLARKTENGNSYSVRTELIMGPQGKMRVSHEVQDIPLPDVAPYLGGSYLPTRNELLHFHEQTQTHAFDGKLLTRFFPASRNGYPVAFILKRHIDWWNDVRTMGIALSYRPLKKPEGGVVQKTGIAITAQTEVVNGRECLRLYHADGAIWADPSRNYLPVRYSTIRRGVTRLKVQIIYGSHDEIGWVPTSWTTSLFKHDGTLAKRAEITVDQYEVNKPLADRSFEIDFPATTLFRDRVTNADYVLSDDGIKIPVDAGKYFKDNYRELRTTSQE